MDFPIYKLDIETIKEGMDQKLDGEYDTYTIQLPTARSSAKAQVCSLQWNKTVALRCPLFFPYNLSCRDSVYHYVLLTFCT